MYNVEWKELHFLLTKKMSDRHELQTGGPWHKLIQHVSTLNNCIEFSAITKYSATLQA